MNTSADIRGSVLSNLIEMIDFAKLGDKVGCNDRARWIICDVNETKERGYDEIVEAARKYRGWALLPTNGPPPYSAKQAADLFNFLP